MYIFHLHSGYYRQLIDNRATLAEEGHDYRDMVNDGNGRIPDKAATVDFIPHSYPYARQLLGKKVERNALSTTEFKSAEAKSAKADMGYKYEKGKWTCEKRSGRRRPGVHLWLNCI